MSTAALAAPAAGVQIVRRIASFPVMLAALLGALAVLTVRERFDDLDMWWHLRTGEVIWSTRSIPTTDLFSYTTNHHAWVPHEWLSQLTIYGAYRLGGYSGLMLWFALLAAALIIAGYALCSLYSGNSKTAFLGALVLWFFSTTVMSIRPQLIGYLLLVVELLLLHLGATRTSRWFFWLPPLFAVWVNCHASFFRFRAGSLVATGWTTHRRRRLMLTLLLSIAALFVNPVGVRQILYPVNTLLRQGIVTTQIDEWKPLLLSDPRGIALLGVVGCILLFPIVRRSELYLYELLTLILGAILALSHQRMAVVFGILAAPVLSRLLSNSWDSYTIERDHPLPNAVLISLAFLAACTCFPSEASLARQVIDGSPVKAAAFIRDHHLQGRMLNAFNYGGYLIWALPEHPVFVDGRADVFEWSGVLSEFADWATLKSDPNMLLDKYGVSFCVLERSSAIAHVMPLLRGWKQVYADDHAVIFIRSTG